MKNIRFLFILSIAVLLLNACGDTEPDPGPEPPDNSFFIPSTGYISPDSYTGKSLVWEDNFDGTALDADTWCHEIGDGCDRNLCGWGNEELQSYKEGNTSVKDGYLVITAKEETDGTRDYTSSRIITKNKVSFHKGRVDIRAAMPFGQGMWPALWMLGNNIDVVSWPACGEVDIMEMTGGSGDRDSKVYGTAHWADPTGQHAEFSGDRTLESGKLYDEFHVYSIEWTDTAIRWYLDGSQYHSLNISAAQFSEFQQEFFFVMNIAVGGNFPGNPDSTTEFPQRMIVDYIRVFQ